jgi:hypothetical protein
VSLLVVKGNDLSELEIAWFYCKYNILDKKHHIHTTNLIEKYK